MDFEENKVPEAILDKYTKVCTCLSISKKTMKDAIREGASTVAEVKEKTRAGSGACRGKNCTVKIVKLLQEAGKLPMPPQKP